MAVTQAFVNHGRWIADCPRPHCGNAVHLEPKQTAFHCMGGCNLIAEVQWPPDVAEITAALAERPVPTTRNWAPAGHRQSLAVNLPEGQTVQDLVVETREFQGPTDDETPYADGVRFSGDSGEIPIPAGFFSKG